MGKFIVLSDKVINTDHIIKIEFGWAEGGEYFNIFMTKTKETCCPYLQIQNKKNRNVNDDYDIINEWIDNQK